LIIYWDALNKLRFFKIEGAEKENKSEEKLLGCMQHFLSRLLPQSAVTWLQLKQMQYLASSFLS
jgi:hypothetical protein